MKTYTIYTAKTHLSQLIEQACAGEEVIIARDNHAVVKLVPLATTTASKRQFGALRGKITVTPAFFDPLPEAELNAWQQ